MKKLLKKMFGDKAFYKKVFAVTLPIMLQQILINIVSLADNLMVAKLSEQIIDGVYIASQIIFVVNLTLFGGVEGAGIFFAQFVGSKDSKNMKQCFTFKVYIETVIAIVYFIILQVFPKQLAMLFVDEQTAIISASYLRIYSFCLVAFGVSNAICTSYRECNKTIIPMFASALALVCNISLNYVFIFALDLKSDGAAIATIISRLIEFGFILIYTFIKKPAFANDIFKHPEIDNSLLKDLIKKSWPLTLNEFAWSLAQITLVFGMSKACSYAASSLSVSTTLFDVCNLANIALGCGIGVIMGNVLGENDLEEANKYIGYFITVGIIMSLVIDTILVGFAGPLANLYNISEIAQRDAIRMCYVNAILMPAFSLNNVIFFMIKSGGKTGVVLIFDSCFLWAVEVPVALLLGFMTNMALPNIAFLIYGCDIIKLIVGIIILASKKWLRNLTIEHSTLKAN